MKNFFKCFGLGLAALLIPVVLTMFIMNVMNSGLMDGIGYLVIGYMAGFTAYWFAHIGKKVSCSNCEDAFWLTTIFNAGVVLVLNIGVALIGWFAMDNFAALPFAFAPVTLSLAYVAGLGATICGMRIYYSGWNMTINDKGLTWSILVLAVVFTACMIIDVCERYLGCYIADFMVTIISAGLVLSICGIIFFACKLIFKSK